MCSVWDDMTWLMPDCSIRTSTDQSLLAAPRSFSQLTTSFFGSGCQGIRPAPLLAWPQFMVFYAIITMLILQQDRVCFSSIHRIDLQQNLWNCSIFYPPKTLLSSMFVIILTFLSRFTLLRCSVFKILFESFPLCLSLWERCLSYLDRQRGQNSLGAS